MIHPVIPQDKKIIISFEKGRAIVSRYRQTAPYAYEVQHARNWLALEADALDAVQAQVGAPEDGHYPCPSDLAARATWPD